MIKKGHTREMRQIHLHSNVCSAFTKVQERLFNERKLCNLISENLLSTRLSLTRIRMSGRCCLPVSSHHGRHRAEKYFCPQLKLPAHLHRVPQSRPPSDPRQWCHKSKEQFGCGLCRLWRHLFFRPLPSFSSGSQVSSQITCIMIKFPGAVWCWEVLCTQFIVLNCSSHPSPSSTPAQSSSALGLQSFGPPRCSASTQRKVRLFLCKCAHVGSV